MTGRAWAIIAAKSGADKASNIVMQGMVSAVPAPGFLILAKPRDFRASP